MDPVDPKEFGKQIAAFRKAQGLSQADLAKVTGIPITAIRRCEQQGSIPLDRYLALASTLNASLKITAPPNIAPQPYKSIQQVIRSGRSKSQNNHTSSELRKPRIGGLFGPTSQEVQRT